MSLVYVQGDIYTHIYFKSYTIVLGIIFFNLHK